MKTNKIFIAGGGTGGHLYPGVAFAKAVLLQAKDSESNWEVAFVGVKGGLEEQIIPREGFRLILLPGGKLNFQGRWLAKLATIFRLGLAILQSCFLLLKEKPSCVLGVGGYASVPLVLSAACLGIPTAIWEPNAFPGMANRFLSRFVPTAFIVFDQAKQFLKSAHFFKTGMPVREEIEKLYGTRKDLTSSHDPLKVLVYGGSQGARALNNVLLEIFESLEMQDQRDQRDQRDQEFQKIHFVHQAGNQDFSTIAERYKSLTKKGWHIFPLFTGAEKALNEVGLRASLPARGIEVELRPFLYDMPLRYQWAEAAVSRAGASSAAELAVAGVVPIFIPLAAADNHQLHNAKVFVDAAAGLLLEQKDLSASTLKQAILNLKNASARADKSQRMRALFTPGGAMQVAHSLLTGYASNQS